MANHANILIFWPGGCHGLCSPWDCKQSAMTEQISHDMAYYHIRLTILFVFSINHTLFLCFSLNLVCSCGLFPIIAVI